MATEYPASHHQEVIFGNRVYLNHIAVLLVFACTLLCFHTASAEEGSPAGVAPTASTPLVLAHYMPWYTAKPASDHWGWHWTMNHFDPEKQSDGKREIASKYYPLIGPYDSGDPNVLEYHLLLMKLAGIDGVIVDWYGLTNFNDYAILHRNTTRLLQQCERLKMKFVICYEDQTIPALVTGNRIAAVDRVSHAATEIKWLNKYWFQSPSYVRLHGKPVLLSFGHTGLTSDEWTECITKLEFPIAYFSQDLRRKGAIGGFGWPSPNAGMQQVDRFLVESAKWPNSIPAAFPRFDDVYLEAGVSKGYPQLADGDGATLQTTLTKAIQSKASIIQIATWNDWGEGTQIEPSHEHQNRDLRLIQKWCRKDLPKNEAMRTAELKLPGQILKLRQGKVQTPPQLDQAVLELAAGNFEQASVLLKAMQE
ncbi:MAG: glycoside hydrolase family 71/99-like protein [Rubripirellula sp.]|nr:glycoside hydrolase family 71/99-like protein [Rubripirellula sp.]